MIRQQPFARLFYQQRARLVRFLVWHLADRPNWEPPTADFKSNRDGTAMKSKLQRRRLRCRHDAAGLLFFFSPGRAAACASFLYEKERHDERSMLNEKHDPLARVAPVAASSSSLLFCHIILPAGA